MHYCPRPATDQGQRVTISARIAKELDRLDADIVHVGLFDFATMFRERRLRRADLLNALSGSDLPLRTIAELRAEAEAICGGAPALPALGDRAIGVETWVDGTLLDRVWQVKD